MATIAPDVVGVAESPNILLERQLGQQGFLGKVDLRGENPTSWGENPNAA